MDVNLENDLLNSECIKNKCRTSKIYPQNLYAAMANNRFFYGDKEWTCSWRYAGELVAQLVCEGGDYMDYYCSGIGAGSNEGFVSESVVTDEIRLDLIKIGWIVKPYDNTVEAMD
jgi:hypothetical protein